MRREAETGAAPESDVPRTDRRSALTALGTAAAGVLAGCVESVGDGNGDADTDESAIRVPEKALLDRVLDVRVTGLPDGATAEITAETAGPGGRTWSASAVFEATDGTVALADQAPIDGDYEGTDPMGLFWSMAPDAVSDRTYFLANEDFAVSLAADVDGETVAEATTERLVADPDVTVERADPDDIYGSLYRPPSGSGPGVVLLHGSGGNVLHPWGKLLASRGFTALAIRYFGDPEGLPDELVEVPVEIVGRAIAWLRDHSAVEGDAVGLGGVSRGGELALLAGAEYDDVGAVVSWSGSGLAFQGILQGPTRSSWTIDGEPVPFVEYVDADLSESQPWELTPLFRRSIDAASDAELAEATISAEGIDGPVLLLSGGDDRLWPAADLHRFAVERAEARGHESVDHRVYDGAGHGLGRPNVPTAGHTSTPQYVFGGTPAGIARARADSWPRALETFEAGLTE